MTNEQRIDFIEFITYNLDRKSHGITESKNVWYLTKDRHSVDKESGMCIKFHQQVIDQTILSLLSDTIVFLNFIDTIIDDADNESDLKEMVNEFVGEENPKMARLIFRRYKNAKKLKELREDRNNV